MQKIYQTVTDQILAQLKAGVRPWVNAWSQTPGINLACNAVTGNSYNGINKLLLFQARYYQYPLPKFITLRQANIEGGHVRKGEHGFMVVKVGTALKKLQSPDEDLSEAPDSYRFWRSYTVFNVAQCDGLPGRLLAMPAGPNAGQRDRQLHELASLVGADVKEVLSGDRAFYSPSRDCIVLPAFQTFRDPATYYATLFHELIHWTGHQSRSDRYLRIVKRFDRGAEAAEELVAEIGAAFLCAEFSIDGHVPYAAMYVDKFIGLLSEDATAIFTCASMAQEAVDYLRERLLADPVVTAPAVVAPAIFERRAA
jgi:antirestriction protein ArdC